MQKCYFRVTLNLVRFGPKKMTNFWSKIAVTLTQKKIIIFETRYKLQESFGNLSEIQRNGFKIMISSTLVR